MTRVRGGLHQYGFTVGILMLDTRFPRIPGDMGNAATFPFPVRYHRVAGAAPARAGPPPGTVSVGLVRRPRWKRRWALGDQRPLRQRQRALGGRRELR